MSDENKSKENEMSADEECSNEAVDETKKDKKTKKSDDETDKKKKIPGVIYLSRIPTKMNVKIIREYFSVFGTVDRIYLEPRAEKKRKNQPTTFTEGWVEFKSKRAAKKVAKELNNNQVGGKRRNPWYSELWNIKYLKNFRWTHLNERLAYEQEIRKQRLRQEVALAKKESNFFIQNYEKSERRKRLDKKELKKNEGEMNNQPLLKKEESPKSEENDDKSKNDNSGLNKRHPLFERKVKVTGNETFLKQIFS